MSSYLPLEYVEYRGVNGLVAAEVLQDDKDGFATGDVFAVAGVAEISKSTNQSTEAHYYDNYAAVVVEGQSIDQITISASAIPLDVLAYITGQYYDTATAAMIASKPETKYFAIGYQYQNTKRENIYCWRYKGTFAVPDRTMRTLDSSTDANGQELIYTGIPTKYRFEKTGKPAKAINVETAKGLVDVTEFFDSVATPDTITPIATQAVISITDTTRNIYFTQSAQNGVVVDWGDGSHTETYPGVTVTGLNGYAVEASHQYASVGEYTIALTAQDGVTWSPGTMLDRGYGYAENHSFLRVYDFLDEQYSPELKTFVFGRGCELNQDYAFAYCSQLKKITIPNGTATIPGFAFYNCLNLETVRFNADITTISQNAFSDCEALTNVVLPQNLEQIGIGAFAGCRSWSNFNLPVSVTSIGAGAFNSCGFTEAAWPANIAVMPEQVFYRCGSLRHLDIPEGVTKISRGALEQTGLLEINIPASVTVITGAKDGNVNGAAYSLGRCFDCTDISVDNNNTVFSSIDGLLYDKAGETLLLSPAGRVGVCEIPTSTKVIDNNAFAYCAKITDFVFPQTTINEIKYNAFGNCDGLTTVKIPSTVLFIGDHIFTENHNLVNVEIACITCGDMGHYGIFRNCKALEKVWFRQTCTTIYAAGPGSSSFRLCGADLAQVYVEASSKPSGYGSYYNYDYNTQLTKPVIFGQTTSPF